MLLTENHPISIPINLIDAHPLNPRGEITEDSVESISSRMKDRFLAVHAVRVRKIGPRYQLIGGHRRVIAANVKGFHDVFAWVEDMSDFDALIELIVDNDYDELDLIEIGVHAYKTCNTSNGGRGNTGGINEYARRIGRGRSQVSRLRKAGEVVVKTGIQVAKCRQMSMQFYEIGKLPERLWGTAADWLVSLNDRDRSSGKGSVRDISRRVGSAVSVNVPIKFAGSDTDDSARFQAFLGNSWRWPSPHTQTHVGGRDSGLNASSGETDTVVVEKKDVVAKNALMSQKPSISIEGEEVGEVIQRLVISSDKVKRLLLIAILENPPKKWNSREIELASKCF